MKTCKFFFAPLLSVFVITAMYGQGVTYINNLGVPTVEDGMLNIGLIDTSSNAVVDILALHRMSSNTANDGLGSGILFRNQTSNGGLSLAGRISSIAVGATTGADIQAMRFDVFSNGSIARTLYLNHLGLGIGTTNPVAMLDINSPVSVPMVLRGTAGLYVPIYESGIYRGYLGSYAGAPEDVDIGTGASNANGKFHITIQAAPKVTVDSDGLMGVNTTAPGSLLHVDGFTSSSTHLIRSTVNYTGNTDVRAVEGHSVTNPGYGIGGVFTGGWRGIAVSGSGGSYSGTSYAGYFSASGTTGTRTAIYASASGGNTNWAGYFGSGNVYINNELRIGTSAGASGYKVAIDGRLIAEEVRIQNSGVWPDYVFDTSYALRSIPEVRDYITEAGHLPGIPPAQQVEEEGILVGEMQTNMMEKIEELTLYIIQLHERIEVLEKTSPGAQN